MRIKILTKIVENFFLKNLWFDTFQQEQLIAQTNYFGNCETEIRKSWQKDLEEISRKSVANTFFQN